MTSADFDIHCAVAAQWEAYNCEPLRPDNIPLCILAVWSPVASKFVGFKPLTQLFGSTSAVLNYNVLSRTFALSSRIFAIPVVGCVGDFGFIVSAKVCEEAPLLSGKFRDLLGLTTKDGKSKFGSRTSYLGAYGVGLIDKQYSARPIAPS